MEIKSLSRNQLLLFLHVKVLFELSAVAAQRRVPGASRPSSVARKFCPFRVLSTVDELLAHMEKYHTPEKGLVCSGCKQKRVIRALFDSDSFSGRVWANLLCRSAMVLRTNANPPLDS